MEWRELLRKGVVIPAHPLALTSERKLDERRQRALTRYYLAAGAGGVAIGVHTTQFEIRDPRIGLYEPVLELAMEELRGKPAVKVAGVVGRTAQAVREAEFAARCGYDAGLLSLGAMRDASTGELLDHARAVAHVIPLFGFYLQPSVGGRILPFEFWRGLAEIENVAAIKIAPFNRYQTLDVVRAVAEAGRAGDIAPLEILADPKVIFSCMSIGRGETAQYRKVPKWMRSSPSRFAASPFLMDAA
jgi:dihydrodipicolinate synthase/N-acetylneuraminate lyase